jgi:SAM-dependent methyltransferase
MNLIDIVHRQAVPAPYSEGEKIPWNEPGFSQRMLLEHLSQEHDAASRRFEIIDKHVNWINHFILSGQPTKILDLGCGPGLYTSRLSKLGHDCTGIDFSPASIEYANKCAHEEKLGCSYTKQDVRRADFGHGYGLVMLIYGEFNAFRCSEARSILEKAHQALEVNGFLLLEAHTFATVRAIGDRPASWDSAEKGLFSDRPHLCLSENFWEAEQYISIRRILIIDALTGEVKKYAESLQAYTTEQYQVLLEECGFRDILFYPSLLGENDQSQSDFTVIVCRK